MAENNSYNQYFSLKIKLPFVKKCQVETLKVTVITIYAY